MKKIIFIMVLVLGGCNSIDGTTLSSVTYGSFSKMVSKGVLLIKQSPSGAIQSSDLNNGLASLKDTNSEPTKWLLTFNISDLQGTKLDRIKLHIHFDGKSPALDHVSALGNLRLYQVSASSNPGVSYWNENLTHIANVITSDVQLNSMQNAYQMVFDITDYVQNSVDMNDQYVTFLIKWDNEVNGSNHNVNFYCNYGSSTLSSMIPYIDGEFQK